MILSRDWRPEYYLLYLSYLPKVEDEEERRKRRRSEESVCKKEKKKKKKKKINCALYGSTVRMSAA